ncbi:T3SS effector HopA1 family protein [Herbidospora mongoliensis]|uniref:T3SS effector HopA1 family protein n=1 Tax=Herbidospora mongoliensis TaxID=688067 RepID=UPI00082ACA7F|nr:T3SS effector HopA1 family protein [Herbidospora mongoliensis]
MKPLLDRVRIDSDLTTATVDDREVTADNPKSLRAALANALYDVLHAGRAAQDGPRPKTIRDPAFERELRAVVPHESSSLLARPEPGLPGVVRLGAVRVRVPDDRLGEEVETPNGPARRVDLPSVLPAASPGFLFVNGSRGGDTQSPGHVRLYVSARDADAAPPLWAAVLTALESSGVPYRAKVLSARDLHPRRDAVVVYLGAQGWHVVPDVAEKAIATGLTGPDVSDYVAPLGPGAGWAWEPQDDRPGWRGLSFGEHRSRAIAAGLMTHAERGGDRDQTVDDALAEAGIAPGALHRNSGSPSLPFETTGL